MGGELTLLFGTTLHLTGMVDTAREAEFGANSQKLWVRLRGSQQVGLNSRLALPKHAVLGGSELIRLAYSDSMLPSVVRSSCLRCCMCRVG
jgi:hypothetical protein